MGGESDEEEFVTLDKHEAQKLINGPDYITDKGLETFLHFQLITLLRGLD